MARKEEETKERKMKNGKGEKNGYKISARKKKADREIKRGDREGDDELGEK